MQSGFAQHVIKVLKVDKLSGFSNATKVLFHVNVVFIVVISTRLSILLFISLYFFKLTTGLLIKLLHFESCNGMLNCDHLN